MAVWTKKLDGNTNYYMQLEVNQVSQDITKNETVLSYKLSVTKVSGSGFWVAAPYYSKYNVVINGEILSDSVSVYDFRGSIPKTIEFASGTVNISHNSDGFKTIEVSGYWSDNRNNGLGEAEINDTLNLSRILRATQPSINETDIYIDSEINIELPRASSAYVHSLWYQVNGSAQYLIGNNIGDRTRWRLPKAILNLIPASTSASITLICRTMDGTKLLGDKTVSFTGNVPDDIVPTIGELKISDTNIDTLQKVSEYVSGHSSVEVSIEGALGIYGSTIVSYRISGAGYTVNTQQGKTGVLNQSGEVEFVATVTDSRGRIAEKRKIINVLNYTSPKLTSFSTTRTNIDGIPTWDGTYVKCTWNVMVHELIHDDEQKNTLEIFLDRMSTIDNNWENYRAIAASKNNVSNDSSVDGVFNATTSYMIRLRVIDVFGVTSIQYATVPTATVALDIGSNNVGIGKMWEKGTIDAIGKIYQNNGIAVGNGYVKELLTVNSAELKSLPSGTYSNSNKATGFPEENKAGMLLVISSDQSNSLEEKIGVWLDKISGNVFTTVTNSSSTGKLIWTRLLDENESKDSLHYLVSNSWSSSPIFTFNSINDSFKIPFSNHITTSRSNVVVYSNGQFTFKKKGRYSIQSTINFSQSSIVRDFYYDIFVNNVFKGRCYKQVVVGNPDSMCISSLLDTDVGDILTMMISSNQIGSIRVYFSTSILIQEI